MSRIVGLTGSSLIPNQATAVQVQRCIEVRGVDAMVLAGIGLVQRGQETRLGGGGCSGGVGAALDL